MKSEELTFNKALEIVRKHEELYYKKLESVIPLIRVEAMTIEEERQYQLIKERFIAVGNIRMELQNILDKATS